MENWLYYVYCAVAVSVATLLIWWWNRGTQRRRFHRAFPRTFDPFWTIEHALFLAAVERAYRLPLHWARRLPPSSTPMGLYLTLYPEHCIYDACENEHFIKLLRLHLKTQIPPEPLTQTFETLAQCWQTATQLQTFSTTD